MSETYPPCARCHAPYADHGADHRCPHQDGYYALPGHASPSRAPWLGIIGGILMALGLYLFVATNEGANACSSGIVSALAPQQCNDYTLGHDAAIVLGIVGLVLVIMAIVKSGPSK